MAYEVLYMATGETPARLDRWWIDRIFGEGVSDVASGQLHVAQRAAGANMTVEVSAGDAIIQGDDVADQGAYLSRSTDTVSLTIGAPPGSGSRTDLVVFRVYDSTATGGPVASDGAVLEVVQGDVGGTAPAVPPTAIPLAEVVVTAGDVAIVNAAITDRRYQLQAETLDVGTQAIPLTTAEREALNDPRPGTIVFDTDVDRLMAHDGSAWSQVSPAPRVDVFTASGTWTRPAGARLVIVQAWGGGAGGNGGGNADYGGYGGGGGGYAYGIYDATRDILGATVSVTVGAGGLGGAANGGTGTSGGSSSFADLTAPGGRIGGTGAASGFVRWVGSISAASGGTGAAGDAAGAPGGSTVYGGGGGAGGTSYSASTPAQGGTSQLGGAGGAGGAGNSPGIPASAGSPPGGGGGGGVGSLNIPGYRTAGAAGARGEVRITTFF